MYDLILKLKIASDTFTRGVFCLKGFKPGIYLGNRFYLCIYVNFIKLSVLYFSNIYFFIWDGTFLFGKVTFLYEKVIRIRGKTLFYVKPVFIINISDQTILHIY